MSLAMFSMADYPLPEAFVPNAWMLPPIWGLVWAILPTAR